MAEKSAVEQQGGKKSRHELQVRSVEDCRIQSPRESSMNFGRCPGSMIFMHSSSLPEREGWHPPKVSVVVPALNEIRALPDTLDQLLGDRFNVSRPEDLSISDASSLIDELKGPAESNGGGR